MATTLISMVKIPTDILLFCYSTTANITFVRMTVKNIFDFQSIVNGVFRIFSFNE